MYYEDKKIIEQVFNEDGSARVTVGCDCEDKATCGCYNGSFDISAWEFDVNSGEEKIDASSARNNRAVYVVDEVYSLLKKLDVRTEEVGYYMQKLMAKFQGVEQAAIIAAFGKTQDDDIRLSDWEKQL